MLFQHSQLYKQYLKGNDCYSCFYWDFLFSHCFHFFFFFAYCIILYDWKPLEHQASIKNSNNGNIVLSKIPWSLKIKLVIHISEFYFHWFKWQDISTREALKSSLKKQKKKSVWSDMERSFRLRTFQQQDCFFTSNMEDGNSLEM